MNIIYKDTKIHHLSGNTYYFSLGWATIPFYVADRTHAIMLDTGLSSSAPIILRGMEREGLNVSAIIHSHMHNDHICGDLLVYQEYKPEIYGSETDLLDAVHTFEHRPPDSDKNEEEIIEIRRTLSLIEHRFHPFEKYAEPNSFMGAVHDPELPYTQTLNVLGKAFLLIDDPGHCLDHKMIVTPDGVCYLADSIMYGQRLDHSKIPYVYDLGDSIRVRRRLGALPFPEFIAAHSGVFSRDELEEVERKNLELSRIVFRHIAAIRAAEPNLSLKRSMDALYDRMSIHNYRDTSWLNDTVRQYIEYYDSHPDWEQQLQPVRPVWPVWPAWPRFRMPG